MNESTENQSTEQPSTPAARGLVQRLVSCSLCGADSPETIYLPLFVLGSEGIEVCLPCRIALTATANAIRVAANTGRKAGYIACNRVHSANREMD